MADLPLTIQDAVFAARKIGVRYLWVDALCIIQDDRADWHRELQEMKQVYMGALFVISALNAFNCNACMFYNRTVSLATGKTSDEVKAWIFIREDPWPYKYENPLQGTPLVNELGHCMHGWLQQLCCTLLGRDCTESVEQAAISKTADKV